MIKEKDPNIHRKHTPGYFAQFENDLCIRENVVCMDNKLVIPNNLNTAINNRIHFYHHGKL